MKRPSLRPLPYLLLAVLLVAGCASSPDDELDPFQVAEQQRDILDEDPGVDDQRRAPPRQRDDDDDEMFIIPEAAAEPARSVDTQPDGWDMDDLRDFHGSEHVYRGHTRWDGEDDAGFAAAVDSDDSHLYFWVEVTDDEVIDSSPQNPLDAVIIHLRDPRLDDLIDALPESLQQQLDVEIESSFAFTPDGSFAPYDGRTVPEGAIHSAGRTTEQGYIVEAAFSLEALAYLAEIPMDRIAFRIDVYDTDDASADRPDTRLSAVVDDDEPRFAASSTGGIRPAVAPNARPPRRDALGLWIRSETEWTFQPLEHISSRWHTVEDREEAAAAITNTDELPRACDRAGVEKRMVEVYEHDNGNHRVILAACGTSASGGSCPSNAETQLVWASLQSDDGQRWSIREAFEVFEDPLEQCPLAAPGNNALYHNFSMLPFDRVDSQLWGIGYRRTSERSGYRSEGTAVRLVDPRAADFVLLDRQLDYATATDRQRELHNARIYLTDLENNDELDVCKIRDIRNQNCDRFDTGCETTPRGHEVTAHIDLWNPDDHRFDDYMLTRHDNCRGSTTFEDVSPGFKILIIGNRLGLLPTMR